MFVDRDIGKLTTTLDRKRVFLTFDVFFHIILVILFYFVLFYFILYYFIFLFFILFCICLFFYFNCVTVELD